MEKCRVLKLTKLVNIPGGFISPWCGTHIVVVDSSKKIKKTIPGQHILVNSNDEIVLIRGEPISFRPINIGNNLTPSQFTCHLGDTQLFRHYSPYVDEISAGRVNEKYFLMYTDYRGYRKHVVFTV